MHCKGRKAWYRELLTAWERPACLHITIPTPAPPWIIDWEWQKRYKTCLCGSVGSKSLCSIQSFKNPTAPWSIKKNLFVVRGIRLSGLLSPGPIQTWGRQSQPKLTNLPKQKQTGEKVGREMLCHGLISECTSHVPWEKDVNLFFSLFPLLSSNFPPSAINVDAITFHNQSSLQALFHGCWSKNSGISLPRPPHRDSWSPSGPVTPSGLSA